MKLNLKNPKFYFMLFLLFNLLLIEISPFEEKSSSEVNNQLENSNKLKNEKSELNTGIFVSESFLKKKSHANPSNTENLPKVTNIKSTINEDKSPVSPIKAANGPILYETWVKFFKYSESEINIKTPTHFFVNNEFFNQRKMFPTANLKAMDEGKSTFIRDKTYFYAILFTKTLNFVTSRMLQLQRTYDSLNLNYIDIVHEENPEIGGITDFGNFNEGFCFKVNVIKPKQYYWIICTDTDAEKKKFMSILQNLKIKDQTDKGIFTNPEIEDNSNKKESVSTIMDLQDVDKSSNSIGCAGGNSPKNPSDSTKKTDGYWMILQNWSQCTLKCGGGNSYLQRMCVPPKNGGKDCVGEAILMKKCNTQHCPGAFNNYNNGKTNSTTVTLKPIVKVMPFSNRPQRYTKCVVKESDLMMTQKKEINNNPNIEVDFKYDSNIKIPTRVIMNNRTISIFAGTDYNTLITTFNMAETKFFRSMNHKTCFLLFETKDKEVELCPFTGSNLDDFEEWDKDFHLFKNQCNTPKDIIQLDSEDGSSLNEKLKDKINEAKKQLFEDREKEIKRKLEKKEEGEMEVVIKNTNKVALEAIQKEINLEEMIKQEESEREARIEEEIRFSIEKEKKKSECVIKAIKERKLENQFNAKAQEAEEQVNKIKKTAADQVLVRRNELRNIISEMRKKAKLRQNKLQQELRTVRVTTAEQMGKAYRKGSTQRCLTALENESNQKSYCQANLVDDLGTFTNCMSGSEDFCLICCDNEFGEIYNNERQSCYKTACEKKKNKDPSSDTAGNHKGAWVWANQMK